MCGEEMVAQKKRSSLLRSLWGCSVAQMLRSYCHSAKPTYRPAGLMVKASVSGVESAEDSGFDSQVGRFCFLLLLCVRSITAPSQN